MAEVSTRRPIYLLIGPLDVSFFIIMRIAINRLTIMYSTKATRTIFINILTSVFILFLLGAR